MSLPIISDLAHLRSTLAPWQAGKITLVPTMGALHPGHLELIRAARQHAARVVASIFVNPRQFAPGEDFASYPRDLGGDVAKLKSAGCDLVWSPDAALMYPPGFASRVEVEGAAKGLETDFRPHFFSGVATVCLKLFNQVQPDFAIFGEKDYQQLAVLRQIVRDFDLPVQIIGHETVREADGLALSSRNAYLSADERKLAPLLHQAILTVANDVRLGMPILKATATARATLEHAGFKVDYVEVRNALTLAVIADGSNDPKRVLVAARLGRTRLIDNLAVEIKRPHQRSDKPNRSRHAV